MCTSLDLMAQKNLQTQVFQDTQDTEGRNTPSSGVEKNYPMLFRHQPRAMSFLFVLIIKKGRWVVCNPWRTQPT